MTCAGSRGDDNMKVSESHGKESKEKKPKTKKPKLQSKNGIRVSEKSKRKKKRKSLKTETRVSKIETEEEKMERKRKRRIAILKEREVIAGGTAVVFDRDDPDTCILGGYLRKLVNLAINFYNEKNSTNYHLVHMIKAIQSLCQGSVFSMTFTVKRPDEDDSDAITLDAEVYRGIPDTVVHFVRVLDDAPSLSSLTT
ncbi:hypothetical protein ABFS82_06G115300 [Erythranthe guttata]|uniref:Cystatin domain-containing protein n=1 Tax=Erythranthe guttata TaxID=4155 RepID=A0A022RUX5_ERYGU|nr:PREDICTED: uncharacterized protein LOC105951060 [Erythranthe guttata]EYU43533.1 hypothetical protein MIMGU_mgv1a014247mg [Erythranthe guttata]|eukprot:XP_012829906.1 PREDICTED: uncharacterized protein LOC105951060 [Erythranthe guttata]